MNEHLQNWLWALTKPESCAITFILECLFAVFPTLPAQAGTSAENAFLKTLVTPSLGTTLDDWIAFMGEPTERLTRGGNDYVNLVFDRGDVRILALVANGIVSRIIFVAMDQKISKTGFTWDESNIWTVLQQYGIRPFELKDAPGYPGMKDGVHGDFDVVFNPPNVPRNRNTTSEFGSLELASSSMQTSETEAIKKVASSLIPEGLTRLFDVNFNSVYKDANWSVEGTVKNNSTVAVNTVDMDIFLYTFNDKGRLLSVLRVFPWRAYTDVLHPGEVLSFQEFVSDPKKEVKTLGAGLELEPFAIPAK